MTKLIALILACLALGLAACGGDDSGGGGDSGGGSNQPADTGGGASGGGGASVTLENVQFNPSDVTIKAGETVTFTNNESIPHDVHKSSGPGGDFASGPDGGMQQGDSFKLKLAQPGTYKYVCHVHAPGMSGTITVK